MNPPDLSPDAVARCLDGLRAIRPTLAEALEPFREADLAGSLDPLLTDVPRRIDPGLSDGRPLATFILGCGRGLVTKAVVNGLRLTQANSLAIVVEPDARRLLASLAVDDWRDALEDARIRFAIGKDLEAAIGEALPEHPNAIIEIGLQPGVGLINGDASNRVPDIRRALGTTVERAMAAISTACRDQAQERERGDRPPSLPTGRWRILSVVQTRTSALKHLGPAIIDAANRTGHEGITQVLDRDGAPFTRSLATTVALRSNADLVVGFLEPGATTIPWRRDYPSLVVVSSNPALLPIDRYSWTERDLVVVTESSFTEPYRRLGLNPLVRPLATFTHPAELVEERATSIAPCDVLVVGTLPPAAERRTDLGADEREAVRRLSTRLVERPEISLDAVCAEHGIATTTDGWSSFHLALAYEATRRKRIAVVVALVDAGFSVRVHGDEGWREALAEANAESVFEGWLSEGLDQAAAFRSAGVVVNINSFATPGSLNMRSFAVPAAGGVLISDDRPALREAFEVGREVAAFKTITELPKVVADLLANDDARDAMADAGRARVALDHSWDAWWAWAEQALRARFPAAGDRS